MGAVTGRWRELLALLTANALSMIGNTMTVIAIPYFVYELTGSATATAGIVLAGQLPNIIVGLLGGHLIDRFSAKRVSLVCDAVNALAVLAIPLLYSLDALHLLLLSGLVFLSQVLDAPGSTARRVLVPELIDRHGLPRERVNGLDSMVETGADLLGPIIAGLLMASLGALGLLYLDAVTFLISFFLILFGVRSRQAMTPGPEAERTWRTTLAWLGTQPTVLRLGLYDVLINLVATTLLALALPVLANQQGDDGLWLGLWMASFAFGTAMTTFVYTLVGHRLNALQLLRWTPVGQAVGLACVAITMMLDGASYLWCLGLFVFGANLGVGSMMDAMILQQYVPPVQRGRVFALFSSLRFSGVPLGLLVGGLLLDRGQAVWLFVLMSVVVLFSAGLWLGRHALVSSSEADLS